MGESLTKQNGQQKKVVDKSCDQKLWKKFWTKVVNKICEQNFEQKMWRKVVKKSCEENL